MTFAPTISGAIFGLAFAAYGFVAGPLGRAMAGKV